MTAKEQALLRECFSCGTIHGGALCCGPIERDPKMERDYIPMPGGWEIQTKGKGSTFRICDKDGDRLAIPDSPYLHETLERMARDVNAAALASDTGGRGVVELGDAAETLRYFADVCKGNCPVGQWPGNRLVEAIHTVLTELADASLRSHGTGFIVSNGKGNAWRMWDETGPEWTYDRDKALRFARREDAEVFAREDEDAWRIEPFAALRAQPAGGGLGSDDAQWCETHGMRHSSELRDPDCDFTENGNG